MPKITHHMSDALLMGYAAGVLPEAFNLIVASHVSLCDDCRAALAAHEATGGALLEEELAEMAPDAMETALAALTAAPQEPRPVASAGAPRSSAPAPLRAYIGGDLDAVSWRPVGMGVKQAILKTEGTSTARLLLIPAGAAMPHHSHKGSEITMVLQGAFMDEDARFARGDVEIADGDTHHTPVADIGEDCICLAVTDAPLQFKSWLPRLMQPFFRI